MSQNTKQIEGRLWDAADELRANSKLKSSEYSVPVLGLIFLRYADHKFSAAEAELAGQSTGRRTIGPADYQARGVLYLPGAARFSTLLRLPEGVKGYTPEIYRKKTDAVFQHVYDCYYGAGKSVYTNAA